MKILPDYLIQYMPELEDALEELRLSVLDHAYELLKRLDIDELSVDEIRQKLELYDIKVDNMSGEWLPNGRFYRLYPSIKHHRSRQNAITAIAKSGGQFEGLWSDDFINKSAYSFNKIQVARHYQLSINADGYFFVSGDTTKNARGQIISSAAQALTTDILINQALPAGYTYLYIPWPRPVYPGDSGYFYNVNMLMHDRLHYAEDCTHYWTLYSDSDSVYVCNENSEDNRYCKVTYVDKKPVYKYGNLPDQCVHSFNDIHTEDQTFSECYDEEVPASTKYDWEYGTNAPWKCPYWIDYHYMNNMTRSQPAKKHQAGGSWPVVEHGTYLDENDDPADPADAVLYVLDKECKELADSESVFPTNCYTKIRHKTTEPNRLQTFTPALGYILIVEFDEGSKSDIANKLVTISLLSIENAEALLSSKLPIKLEFKQEPTIDEINSVAAAINELNTEDHTAIKIVTHNTIDSNELTEVDAAYSTEPGAYRFEKLYDGYMLNIQEKHGHFKEYKPFWCESTLWSDMLQNQFITDTQHSLKNWFDLKSNQSRPVDSSTVFEPVNTSTKPSFGEGIIRDNDPIVSEVVFNSFCKPTRGKLDPIYVCYLTGDQDSLDENVALQDGGNLVYEGDSALNYDPEFYYTIVGLNYKSESNGQSYKVNHISDGLFNYEEVYAGFVGDPATRKLKIYKKDSSDTNNITHNNDGYNYISYKKSRIHKFWFNASHTNATLSSSGRVYNMQGNKNIYSCSVNNVIINYHIIGVFDENGASLNYTSGNLMCTILKLNDNNREYILEYVDLKSGSELIESAAYILCTVSVRSGQMVEVEKSESVNTTYLNTITRTLSYANIGLVQYTEAEPFTYINGGDYNTSSFSVDLPIDGGDYNSSAFSVESSILGGDYNSDSFNVESAIIGGDYNSDAFTVESAITGGDYDSNEFSVESAVAGGDYDSDEFSVESAVAGGDYDSDQFDVN